MSNPATDPRTPTTNLSTEEAAPITHFVSAAPKADYSVEELQKGRPGVSGHTVTSVAVIDTADSAAVVTG
jgi:hypothetical protein